MRCGAGRRRRAEAFKRDWPRNNLDADSPASATALHRSSWPTDEIRTGPHRSFITAIEAAVIVQPRSRLNSLIMRNRFFLFSFALAAFTTAILLFEAHAGTPMAASEHCGFWTTIEAGLSCR